MAADSRETVQRPLSPPVPEPTPSGRGGPHRKRESGPPRRRAGLPPPPRPATRTQQPTLLWAAFTLSHSVPGRPPPTCPQPAPLSLRWHSFPGARLGAEREVPGPAPRPGARRWKQRGLPGGGRPRARNEEIVPREQSASLSGAGEAELCLLGRQASAGPCARWSGGRSTPTPSPSGLGSRQEVPRVHLSCSPPEPQVSGGETRHVQVFLSRDQAERAS